MRRERTVSSAFFSPAEIIAYDGARFARFQNTEGSIECLYETRGWNIELVLPDRANITCTPGNRTQDVTLYIDMRIGGYTGKRYAAAAVFDLEAIETFVVLNVRNFSHETIG